MSAQAIFPSHFKAPKGDALEWRRVSPHVVPRPLPDPFDQARDELFSHILRCGVLEALPEHQKEWFDDTMQYLGERYNDLTAEELTQVRMLGERYCPAGDGPGTPNVEEEAAVE